jgi:hypothetical protein
MLSAAGRRAALALFRGEALGGALRRARPASSPSSTTRCCASAFQLGWSLGQILLLSERYREAAAALDRALAVAALHQPRRVHGDVSTACWRSPSGLCSTSMALEHLDVAEEMAPPGLDMILRG